MSDKKSAYGTPATDTSFRKTFDRAEYAAKAAEKEAAEKEERKARYEAKLAGKKYYAPLTGAETLSEARSHPLDIAQMWARSRWCRRARRWASGAVGRASTARRAI